MMAKIDDLLDEIADKQLGSELRDAVKELRNSRSFGLVFEEHIPEEVALLGLPIRKGCLVQIRTRPGDTTKYEVESVDNTTATIRHVGNEDDRTTEIETGNLMVLRRFGEPVYPGLTEVDALRRGPDHKPAHTIINAENFHALQLLTYTHAGKVDVIYIDPPYNTGDKSWKYNNRFVDANDQWWHSKWLSMMEKRLKLAKSLLKLDGILIITIDEHEVHHLGVLLEQLFPEGRQQMITVVNNTAGSQRPSGFTRAEEHAFFIFFGDSNPQPLSSDLLADERKRQPLQLWFPLVRSRGIDDRPSRRPGLVYPIGIDRATGKIAGVGRTLTERQTEESIRDLDTWSPHTGEFPTGVDVVWPVLDDGTLSRWQLKPATLLDIAGQGFVRTRRRATAEPNRGWSISYVKTGNRRKVHSGEIRILDRESDGQEALILGGAYRQVIPKTVWKRGSHDARIRGTTILRSLIGPNDFTYPKSPYAVMDMLATTVGNKPDAVVLDFFAGSGTTLHATCMLNAKDNGKRTCILVTNNDVADDDEENLTSAGFYKGDSEFEARGIFEAVTLPRVQAAISGRRVDGTPVPGSYLKDYLGRDLADGFDENAIFFRLDYLDPDMLTLGRQYRAIAPLLWLAAGAVGEWADREGDEPWSAPTTSNYAVLFDEDRFADFREMLEEEDRITHVWVVTNSSQGFVEMRAQLPDGLERGMLYRDYLLNFRVNTSETFA